MYNFTVMHENVPVANVFISDDHKQVNPEAMVMVAGSSERTYKFCG